MDKDSGAELASNVSQMVLVRQVTSKSAGLPDWWKEKYRHAGAEGQKFIVDLVNVPDDAHTAAFPVPWRAAGPSYLTSRTSYPDFCADAAMRAIQDGFYSKFQPGDDIRDFNVKRMDMNYQNWSEPGDTLMISTWENKNSPLILHFDISKDGRIVNQSTMEFYDK